MPPPIRARAEAAVAGPRSNGAPAVPWVMSHQIPLATPLTPTTASTAPLASSAPSSGVPATAAVQRVVLSLPVASTLWTTMVLPLAPTAMVPLPYARSTIAPGSTMAKFLCTPYVSQ